MDNQPGFFASTFLKYGWNLEKFKGFKRIFPSTEIPVNPFSSEKLSKAPETLKAVEAPEFGISPFNANL